jgi:hypothetical protein
MLELHVKRSELKAMREQRDRMIAALYANSNMDTDEGLAERNRRIQELSDMYEQAEEVAYGVRTEITDEELEANPFMAPAVRATRELMRA